MENPAKKRRKIVVLLLSPNKTKVLVRKERGQSFWNIPDSHLHWPIGRVKLQPSRMAEELINDAVSGCIDINPKTLERRKLPSKGFVYEMTSKEISESLKTAERVKKQLKCSDFEAQMHSTDEIKLPESHSKYGSSTIEAIRSIL